MDDEPCRSATGAAGTPSGGNGSNDTSSAIAAV